MKTQRQKNQNLYKAASLILTPLILKMTRKHFV